MSSGLESYFVSFREMKKGWVSSSCNLGKAQWMTTDRDSNDPNIDPPDTTNWGRVLIVIHGFNVNEKGFEEDFDHLVERIKKLPLSPDSQYTHIVGILWPAEAHLVKYEAAKTNAKTLAQDNESYQFRSTLMKICECNLKRNSGTVDVLAHSLGNFLLFEALKAQPGTNYNLVRYIFSYAPAVNNDSLKNRPGTYYSTLSIICAKVYVFFSREDSVLEVEYPVEEWHLALGYSGAEDSQNTPSTYTQIDCTECIHGHSEYWISEDISKILAKLVGLTRLPTQKTFIADEILKGRPARRQPSSLWKPLLIAFAILAIFGFLYTRSNATFDNRA